MNKAAFLKALANDKTVRLVDGGRHCLAATKRTNKAICWLPHVDGNKLRSVYNEAKALGLKKPIRVYGYVSAIAESETFRFEQVSPNLGEFRRRPR